MSENTLVLNVLKAQKPGNYRVNGNNYSIVSSYDYYDETDTSIIIMENGREVYNPLKKWGVKAICLNLNDFRNEVVEILIPLPENGINIINATPHDVVVIGSNLTNTYHKTGLVVRCQQKTTIVGSISGIPLTSTIFGNVEGLPPQRDNIYYIVSRLVMQALPNRTDLLGVGEVVRNEQGIVIGCRSFSK